jgi:serine/threonine protein kinase/formylglycine-generating enzyme required for sulfatase activity
MPISDNSPCAAGQPSEAMQRVEAVMRSFEDAWRRGARPRLADYLPAAGPERWPLLVELAHEDLDYRLQAGEAARVEDYLADYPELAADSKAVLGLIAAEYQLRRRREPGCAATEYLQRFPQYAAVLPDRLAAPGLRRNAPGPGPVSTFDDGVQAATPRPGDVPEASAANRAVPGWPSVPGYEILGELGRGGMGIVYLAINKLMNRREVLKMMTKGMLDSSGSKVRFLREIQSAARLSHPNVVTVYSAMEVGDLLVFTMEYIEGEDLARLVNAHGQLPVANACYYTQQVALGLQHAFEKHMVHRDIKPQNLILSREGNNHLVKVLDFGLAKVMREKDEDLGLTVTGQMLGTPNYVAPEQIRDASNADIRADIYSLGCTLYHLLRGAPPFKGKSLYEIFQAHHLVEAKALNLLRPEVSEELAALVRKMMEKEPAKRYQKPIEVAQALAPFVEQDGKRASVGTVVEEGAKPKVPTAEELLPAQRGSRTSAPSRLMEARAGSVARENQLPDEKRTTRKEWLIVSVITASIMLLLLGVYVYVQTLAGRLPGSGTPNASLTLGTGDTKPRPPGGKEGGQVGGKELPETETVDLGGGMTMEFVRIPPGTFLMGSPQGEPYRQEDEWQHEVEITRAFSLGKYAVTQQQYEALMGTNPSGFSARAGGKERVQGLDTSRFPVEYVSWDDAVLYCTKLTEKSGNGRRTFRLPTEAEWEYSCRAGSQTAFSFGAVCNGEQANCDGKFPFGTGRPGPALGRTCAVDSYQPNAWGLYNMHGNVGQWCQDWYNKDYYANSPKKDPQCQNNGENRVWRGGYWGSNPGFCRAACRAQFPPSTRYSLVGFRIAISLD